MERVLLNNDRFKMKRTRCVLPDSTNEQQHPNWILTMELHPGREAPLTFKREYIPYQEYMKKGFEPRHDETLFTSPKV